VIKLADRRDKPYIWITWLSKLIAGESQCEYASWYKAHFKTAKSSSPQQKTETPSPSAQSSTKKTSARPPHKNTGRAYTPARKSTPSRGGRKPAPQRGGGKRFTTNHDPLSGRPTFEKREKYHPTNFLPPVKAGEIRVIPIGGLEQVGMNMMMLEWGNDILIIDMGLTFPSPEHLGVDVLIPDISYLRENKDRIRGVVFTHGHLDHIGGVPYMARELGFPPMYASRLTKELILAQSAEHLELKNLRITETNPKSKIKLGRFEIEFFHVNHSIPDGLGIVVHTPYGAIVNTSDFKIDHNPSDDMPADLGRIAAIGKKGVALAMVDSTNITRNGYTISESVIEKDVMKLIKGTKGRLVFTTFASTIGRIAKIVEAAEEAGRTVYLSGRSMERNLAIARKLNYLKCKDATLQRMSRRAETDDPSKVLVLSTGSQGEELAALTRMAAGVHKDIKLTPQDTVVFSSSPIPGNETAIVSVLNNLSEIECKVIDKEDLDIYVSGHGYKEELKLMTTLLNPKYFAPIHGELYMRHEHREVAVAELGFKRENTFIMKNGQGVLLSGKGCRLMTDKEKLPSHSIMLELGDVVGERVMADRTLMADGGIIFAVIKQHNGKCQDVILRSRGFRFMGMKHEIFDLLKKELKDSFTRVYDPARPEKALEEVLRKNAEKLLLQKFKKEMVVEVVL